jgi:hypothetical protein
MNKLRKDITNILKNENISVKPLVEIAEILDEHDKQYFKLNILDINGKNLKVGDIVDTVYESPFNSIGVRGIIDYDEDESEFVIDFIKDGGVIPINQFVDMGIEYRGHDKDNLGIDHELFKDEE